VGEDVPQLGAVKVVDGQELRLAWQDEFNEAPNRRRFGVGADPIWEGVDLWYSATWDDEVYKPENARVEDGRLRITLEDTPAWDQQSQKMHKFTSAMLQSWNKVCYTGGYFETRARMPGSVQKGGQWGAVWMAGNLGRPGRLDTSVGTWPYSYNQCDKGVEDQRGLDAGTMLPGQRISACDPAPGPGLNPNQGRGMPEIDLFELFVPTSGGDGAHITTSLQMGPIIPTDTNHGPGLTGCPGDPRDRDIYENCGGFTYFHNHSLPVHPNKWCHAVEGNDRANHFQDCLSAEVGVEQSHFDEFHTYGMLWEPEERVAWYVDGHPVFEVRQNALEPKRSPSNSEFEVGQRDIPTEPMSLLINVAISDTGVMNWHRGHTWPLHMDVDYVRIYQDASRGHSLGCSPDSHPTKEYIEAHRELYGVPVCNDGRCDDGECAACPSDCAGNIACPGSHLHEVPAAAGWHGEGVAAPAAAACSAHPGCVGLSLAGSCCPNDGGAMLGCCSPRRLNESGKTDVPVGRDGRRMQAGDCHVSFAPEGMRVHARGSRTCTVRRSGLLPTGPLQDTRKEEFSLMIQTEGQGFFRYAVTIGDDGTMCDPSRAGCGALYLMPAGDEVALCDKCEGRAAAPGLLGQQLNRIDLGHRFPYFLGSSGGTLKLEVEAGADVLFRHVRLGPFALPREAAPALSIVRRGFWLEQGSRDACANLACSKEYGQQQDCFTCRQRIAFLQTPEGGSKPLSDARSTIADQYPLECWECNPSPS